MRKNKIVYSQPEGSTRLTEDFYFIKEDITYCAGCGETTLIEEEHDGYYDVTYKHYCTCENSKRWVEINKERATLTKFLDELKEYMRNEEKDIKDMLAEANKRQSIVDRLRAVNKCFSNYR